MPTVTTLPQEIEIFKPGRHIDMAGQVHEFTAADVQSMAQAYDPGQREAPLCVGHPEDNKPAYGFVKALAVNPAGRLVMNTHQVAPEFAELVQAGRFKKRSAAFYSPTHPNNPTPGSWYLRHVAFLGAQPPAISGLTDIAFADVGSGIVEFEEPEIADQPHTPVRPVTPVHPLTVEEVKPTMSDKDVAEKDELQKQLQASKDATEAANAKIAALTAERDAANAMAASFAERAQAEQTAAFTSFAEAQIKTGALLPKDKATVVAALTVLAQAKPVEFAEGDATRKVDLCVWLKELITGTKPVVSFGEFKPSMAPFPSGVRGKSDADIDAAARAYAAQHNVSYSQALGIVASCV